MILETNIGKSISRCYKPNYEEKTRERKKRMTDWMWMNNGRR
jgi:hypothetical protein